MAGLSISRAWHETRQILQRDSKLLIAVAAALFLLPQILTSLIEGQTGSSGPAGNPLSVLVLIATLIGLVGQLAIARLVGGPATSVRDGIVHGLRRSPMLIGALLILLLVLVAIGLIVGVVLAAAGIVDLNVATPTPRALLWFLVLMLIPLFFLAVRLMPATPVAALETGGPLAVLRRSWDLSAGHFGRLAGFLLLFLFTAVFVLAVAGMFAGLVVAAAGGEPEPMSLSALIVAVLTAIVQAAVTLVYVVMLTRIYLQLTGPDHAVSVPSSGT